MNQPPSIRFTEVKRVGRAFNAAGQPTTYILLGSKDGGLLDIYLPRSAIKKGDTAQSPGIETAPVEVRAHWKGLRYSQSPADSTWVNLTVESLTPDEAVIEVAATLYRSANDVYFKVAESKIRLKGQQAKELMGGSTALP